MQQFREAYSFTTNSPVQLGILLPANSAHIGPASVREASLTSPLRQWPHGCARIQLLFAAILVGVERSLKLAVPLTAAEA